MRKLQLILIFTILHFSSFAQGIALDTIVNINQITSSAEKGTWKIVKQDKGIVIKLRSIKLNQNIKTRELTAHFKVNSTLDTTFSYLYKPHLFKAWNKGVKKFTLLESDSIHWITHSVYDIPFPFTQQDLVTTNNRIDTNNTLIINTISRPSFIEPLEDVDRIKFYIAQWIIEPIDTTGEINITFSAITLSKSYIPRFIKDPIVQNNLLKSFISLKKHINTY